MANIVLFFDRTSCYSEIESSLKRLNHEVRVAGSAEEAIDLAYLFSPDLLISDYELCGDYSGLELAEACRHATSNRPAREVKTVLISHSCEKESELNCPHVTKTLRGPVSADEVVRIANAIVSKPANTDKTTSVRFSMK